MVVGIDDDARAVADDNDDDDDEKRSLSSIICFVSLVLFITTFVKNLTSEKELLTIKFSPPPSERVSKKTKLITILGRTDARKQTNSQKKKVLSTARGWCCCE